MSQTEIIYLVVALFALFAFAYGLSNLLRDKKDSYYAFVVLGSAGLAMGRVFLLFLRFISPSDTRLFNVGTLGIFSGFVCIAFACSVFDKAADAAADGGTGVGSADSNAVDAADAAADGGNAAPKKYARFALLFPALYAAYLIVMLAHRPTFDRMLVSYLYALSVAPCGYFCLRNIVTPCRTDSRMRAMRPFFAHMLGFCLLVMANELTWLWQDNAVFISVSNIVLTVLGCGCYAVLPILLERGDKQWKKT